MLFSTMTAVLILFAASADALPRPQQSPTKYTPVRDLSKLAKYFPKSALPAPDGQQLKYVVLGIGTQNYTCGSDENAAPGTTGALATLYDIGSKLNDDWMAPWKIPTMSPLALSLSSMPDMLDWSLRSQGYNNIAGHHYFSQIAQVNTPIFAFDQLSASPYPLAQVAKLNGTDAPASACPGSNGLPAIQWLYLKDITGASAGGIDTVYRVETAGGNRPATCKGMQGSWQVKYAAQYWIFGPKQ
ncbi:hypothetical protein IAQ61_003103 [Plenodomus lingam]|uniref:Malate dehydrogenase n=1 Tax=Leptosphaeria maculans (strain JN3 / isolate v23.1.3 / race Av1-4-5-6-7-8) TaxID=985895 RepID=E5ADJ3_LEPMJ|nr:hypothetical protein LEMA_P000690.1 [Plenodomus lingam JN3]KAH9875639.1 hypothetical protein IAQ61_003103 [Plenodomus lingam]CBY01282.1 hypothetical protein LEMA_P000690.1 [Plenodomus lingam JN3]